MARLEEVLTKEPTSAGVIDACCKLVETEVKAKSGVSGFAVKAGYGAVQKVKPSMVRDVVTRLLPEFARALDPFYQRSLDASPVGQKFQSELESNSGEAADALLGVTDHRIARAQPLVQKTYAKLRKSAQNHVRDAVPALGRTLAPFVD